MQGGEDLKGVASGEKGYLRTHAHMCTHVYAYTGSGRLSRVTVLLVSGNHA